MVLDLENNMEVDILDLFIFQILEILNSAMDKIEEFVSQ